MRACQHPDLVKELVHIEERQIVRSHKIGVIHLFSDQTTEQQALANETVSPAFSEFLHWLGDPVRLQGWQGYRGGLDVKGDTTGKESFVASWRSNQIMFHCASLIPFNPRDRQQIERRRFIGNDIVVIVFQEGDGEVDLSTIRSKQTHIVCIVRPQPEHTAYRIAIAAKEGISNFAPFDFPSLLERTRESRDLLLWKLINGERAAYRAEAFANQILRTREALLQEVIERCGGYSELKRYNA
ncbi:hypothetical protein DFQ26_008041 [Actinomortierella ambigua]|nr:hypothetical protein DFQ26_008041 [Actinomortierella ambigua]